MAYMRQSSRLSVVALAVLLLLTGLPIFEVMPTSEAAAGKVTICHRTRSVTNPYRLITVSQNAAVKNAGHKGHTGGVFVTTAGHYTTNPKNWGDILPGGDSDGDAFNGSNNIATNWTTEGKKFFPGGVNAALCGKMTAKQFYDIQIAEGVSAADIVADLNCQVDQCRNES